MLVIGLVLATSAYGQTTWYVDVQACPDVGSGTESDPFCTIQDAIDAATSGDTVLVADGVYMGIGNRDLTFADKALTVASVNGPATCTIDCGATTEEAYRGFLFDFDTASPRVVDGFSIVNGRSAQGGAIACTGVGGVIIRNCIIRSCEAFWGGGIYGANSSGTTITDCTFAQNMANWGGGVCVNGGDVLMQRCTVEYNRAVYNDAGIVGGEGGGIYLFNAASVDIFDCTVAANHAEELGGGIACQTGHPTLRGCMIADNEAPWGGGLAVGPGQPAVYESTIVANVASADGGGIFCSGAELLLSESVISENRAAHAGGGLYHLLSGLTMMDRCTITANMAGSGGGLKFNADTTAEIYNSRIVGNIASSGAGAVHFEAAHLGDIYGCTVAGNASAAGGAIVSMAGSDVFVVNSIVWDNEPAEVYSDGATTTVAFSDVRGGWFGAGSNNMDVDPLFVATGFWLDNGTPGDLTDDAWVDGNYRVLPGSPCIDAGDNVAAVGAEDLDGVARVIDGDADGTATIDMGGYEFHCGDGVWHADEMCDDGNSINGDGCDENCTPTGCGNGVITTGEECDDGNTLDGDGCSATCTADNPPSTDLPCSTDADCVLADNDACTWNTCGRLTPGYCDPPFPTIYGDVCGARFDDPPNGIVNLTDMLCGMAAFGDTNFDRCPNADIMVADPSACPQGNGQVNLVDLLKISDAIGAPTVDVDFACSCPRNP